MLTPSDYKKRYENIDVRLKDGRSVTVKVNKYRLAGKNVNTTARSAFLAALAKRGIDTPCASTQTRGLRVLIRESHTKSSTIVRARYPTAWYTINDLLPRLNLVAMNFSSRDGGATMMTQYRLYKRISGGWHNPTSAPLRLARSTHRGNFDLHLLVAGVQSGDRCSA